MKKKGMSRRNWSKKDQPSQKRTQEKINELHNSLYWLLSDECINIDDLVSFENQLDDSWD